MSVHDERRSELRHIASKLALGMAEQFAFDQKMGNDVLSEVELFLLTVTARRERSNKLSPVEAASVRAELNQKAAA